MAKETTFTHLVPYINCKLTPLPVTIFFSLDWFKAGKGPDPALASLDRDMDAYFLGKAAAVDVSTLPVSASAESVPMTV